MKHDYRFVNELIDIYKIYSNYDYAKKYKRMSAHEYQITIFSPEGKLHQIEYAFKAIKSCNLTSIGVRGRDCVAVCIEKKIDDRMIDPASITHIHRITSEVGCLVTGRESDGRAWISRLRHEAFKYLEENGHQIPVDILAMRAADIAQLYTQKSFMRPYAVELMLFSVDNERGPQLFGVDPAGHFMSYFGVSAGVKEHEASDILEKEFKKRENFNNLSEEETIRVAIESLQNTMGLDFKPTDIEVAMVNRETRTFKKLSVEEIEANLQIIQRFE